MVGWAYLLGHVEREGRRGREEEKREKEGRETEEVKIKRKQGS